VHMMASQGGVALGAILWGQAAASLGLSPTLLGGALLLTASLALAVPLSINFAHALDLELRPMRASHDFPWQPEADDGPVTVTREIIVRPEDREEFFLLIEKHRRVQLRNGAIFYRVEENLEHPGTFRTEMTIGSWAEHMRQHARTTKSEVAVAERVLALHAGDQPPIIQGQCLAMCISFSERRKNLFAGHSRRDFLSSRA
jgi:hypothetical protein